MSNIIISPNMNLPTPVVSVDPGPDWANQVITCFGQTGGGIDSHDHSAGKGVPITPAGININSDLSFGSHNATTLRSARFTVQGAPLSTGADLGCIYVSGADLYYNDTSGNQVRITTGGNVNAGAGSITGLPSGTASASFSAGTFTFQSATNTPAALNVGPVTIGQAVASGFGVTVSASNSQASNYNLALPVALPGSTSVVTLDASGNLAAAATTGSGNFVRATNPTISNPTVSTGTFTGATMLGQTSTGGTFSAPTITGAQITTSTIDSTTIGATTPAAATVTTLTGVVDDPSLSTNIDVRNTHAGGGRFLVQCAAATVGPLVAGDSLISSTVGNMLISPNVAGKTITLTAGVFNNTAGLSVNDAGLVTVPGKFSVGSNSATHSAASQAFKVALFSGTLAASATLSLAPTGAVQIFSVSGMTTVFGGPGVLPITSGPSTYAINTIYFATFNAANGLTIINNDSSNANTYNISVMYQ